MGGLNSKFRTRSLNRVACVVTVKLVLLMYFFYTGIGNYYQSTISNYIQQIMESFLMYRYTTATTAVVFYCPGYNMVFKSIPKRVHTVLVHILPFGDSAGTLKVHVSHLLVAAVFIRRRKDITRRK